MDPISFIGLAASITSLVEFSFKVVRYLEDIKEGGKDRRRLNDEVISLWMSLRGLEAQFASDEVDHNDAWLESIRALAEPKGTFEQIHTSLDDISDKLISTPTSLPRKIMLTLKWPLNKEEVDRKIAHIDRLKNSVILALSQANISLAKETRDDVSELKRTAKYKQLQDIIDWISPLNFLPKQEAIQGVPGTGAWFFKRPEVEDWMRGGKPVLCLGIPGAGKTFLASAVIDKLHALHKGQNIAALIVFCSYDDQNTHSIDYLISSLLKQVIQTSSGVSKELADLYQRHSKIKSRPPITELCKCLSLSLNRFEKIFIVIDALDEMQDESQRLRLLDYIQSLDGSPNWMVTSRPLDDIICHFKSSLHGDVECYGCGAKRLPFFTIASNAQVQALMFAKIAMIKKMVCPHEDHDLIKQYRSRSVEIAAHPEDIDTYILSRLEHGSRLRKIISRKQGLQQLILDTIKEKAKQMFLLARYYMDELAEQDTAKEVSAALHTLPREIDKTYDQAMQRIKELSENRRKRVYSLMLWIVYAERLMTIAEIEHAITVIPGTVEIDKDDIPSAAVLTSMCAGLVIIDEAGNVRLAHETVGKYLKNNQSDLFPEGESIIASSCLTYLQLDAFKQGACFGTTERIDFEKRKERYPLQAYAALYWGVHAQRSNTPLAISQTLAFLNCESRLASSVQAMWYTDMRGVRRGDAKDDVAALHIAAYFGLDHAMSELLAYGASKDVQDSLGTTPLMYASTEGHATVVEILLQSGASASVLCQRGSSALQRAAEQGNSKVVQQLLCQKDVALNSLYNHQSALMLAASKEYIGIVNLLLDRSDLQINQESSFPRGWTALMFAAADGRTQIVKMLLDHPNILMDHQDFRGWTALTLAAINGHVPAVEALLNRGANIDLRDYAGGTSFLRAIDYNQFSVVHFLMNSKVDYSFKDIIGRTVIHGAAYSNRAKILWLLLKSNSRLDVNTQGVRGETALHDTAALGHIESTRILLDFGARTDIRDKYQRTPVRVAKDKDKSDILELLKEAREKEVSLKKPEVSTTPLAIERDFSPIKRVDSFSSNHEVPFYIAVQRRKVDELQSMIDLAGSDKDKYVNQMDPDNLDLTALHYAAKLGRLDVVNMLLRLGASPNVLDAHGQSPLHCTSEVDIAHCLIHNGADLNLVNRFGRTPWEEAFGIGSFGVALFLVEKGAAIRQDAPNLQSLISTAASLGNLNVIKRLFKMNVALQLPNENGLTPYKIAKNKGHDEVAQFLFEAISTYKLPATPPLAITENTPFTSAEPIRSPRVNPCCVGISFSTPRSNYGLN